MLNLGANSNAPMSNGSLNLGVQNGGGFGGGGFGASPQQNMFGQPQQNMFGQPQQNMYGQQQQQPPSELEIQLFLMQNSVPIERYMASPQMGILVEMIGNLITLNVLEVLRNATFNVNDDGTMQMDTTSLPQNLQTMSAENVTAQFSNLQSSATQKVNESQMTSQQVLAMQQQNALGGALSNALQDEGTLQKMGTGIGSIGRSFMGLKG